MRTIIKSSLGLVAASSALAGYAGADSWYVSLQGQWQNHNNSPNNGALNEAQAQTVPDFTVATVAGNVNPDIYEYGWETTFDTGFGASAEIGRDLPNGFRGSLEVAFERADVKDHRDGSVAFAGVFDEDGDGLFEDDEPRVNVTPNTLDQFVFGGTRPDIFDNTPIADSTVREGTNSITNLSAFANLYYDFAVSKYVKPYIGAGIGISNVDVDYAPDGVDVAEADSVRFAYQGKAGVTVPVTENFEVFGEYTYRATSDVKGTLGTTALASIDVTNKRHLAGVGLRLRFG